MDEGKKAASVAQLKELHDAVIPRLNALEAEDKAESDSQSKLDAFSSQLLMLQQKQQATDAQCTANNAKCEQMMAKMDEPDVPPDFTPIIALITKQGEQLMALLTQCMTQMAQMNARPVTKTGEAVLPDGGRIRLQVSETRM